MNGPVISREDADLMLSALDRFKGFASKSALDRIESLQTRIINGDPHVTHNELINICLGLELLALDSPLNWKVSQLLSRLRSAYSIPRQLE